MKYYQMIWIVVYNRPGSVERKFIKVSPKKPTQYSEIRIWAQTWLINMDAGYSNLDVL